MDWQRYSQAASAAIVRAERKQITGYLELKVFYRNGLPRRGYLRSTTCRILNREPIESSVEAPEREFERLKPQLITEGSNADSEISVQYSFFQGTVVDIKREVINMMS